MTATSQHKLTKFATLLVTIASSSLLSHATTPNSATLSNFSNSGYIIYTDTGVGTPSELAQTSDLSQTANALAGNLATLAVILNSTQRVMEPAQLILLMLIKWLSL